MNGLTRVVEALREALGGSAGSLPPAESAEAATKVLQSVLPAAADVLTPEQLDGDPERFANNLLHAEERFSVTALVWRPGQVTSIHDHICWGAVAVLQGAETETRFVRVGNRLTPGETFTYPAGEVCWFVPPEDVHQVRNAGEHTAISLHVYGADLSAAGSSVRRTYP